jgi:hypothetical protein
MESTGVYWIPVFEILGYARSPRRLDDVVWRQTKA